MMAGLITCLQLMMGLDYVCISRHSFSVMQMHACDPHHQQNYLSTPGVDAARRYMCTFKP